MIVSDSVPLLRLENISKHFGRNQVLRDVGLILPRGEIRGLVGQNGSGKSTLIKILSGYHSPDSGGRIEVDGLEIALPVSVKARKEAGLHFVHQDLGLVGELSVMENVCLARFETAFGNRIRRRQQRDSVQGLLASLGGDIDAERRVADLSQGDQALVAIGRALWEEKSGSGKVLVLDEVTAGLSSDAVGTIVSAMKRWASRGGSVLFVSHRLEEVLEITQTVTVLREGSTIGTFESGSLDEGELIFHIVGKKVDDVYPERREHIGRVVLDVHSVNGEVLKDVNFLLREGEVLGITGLPGGGFDELPYALMGLLPHGSAELRLNDDIELSGSATVADRVKSGMVLVPGDRKLGGIASSLTIRENTSLPIIHGFWRRGRIDRSAERSHVFRLLEEYGIVARHLEQPIHELSGGNQQKVSLGKWLMTSPLVLVLHEPTHGVDPKARQDIFRIIRRSAAGGVAILIASLEYEEVARLCDRVLIFQRGRIAWELEGESLTRDIIVDRCYRRGGTDSGSGGRGHGGTRFVRDTVGSDGLATR